MGILEEGGVSLFLKVFFVILVVYLSISLICYITSKFYYSIHLGLLRKGLYFIFVSALLGGFLLDQISYQDWQLMLQLAAFIIFIDLSIFQTPNILKIWSAEFQHANAIADNIQRNEERIQHMNRKATIFTTIIQQTDSHPITLPSAKNGHDYLEKLELFLTRYTQEFDFSLKLYSLPLVDDDQFHILSSEFATLIDRTANTYNITIDNKDEIIDELLEANVQSVKDGKHVFIPLYGYDHHLLIILSANAENVIEIDTTNIINLIFFYNQLVQAH